MEYWQREHLRRNQSELLQLTSCNALFLAKLQEVDILHAADVEILSVTRDTKGGIEVAIKLYEILQRKVGAFDLLKEALSATSQTGALSILSQYKSEVMRFGTIQWDTTRLLGEGSMSTKVFNGKFEGRSHPVAVKVIPKALVPEGRAMQEINLLMKLDAHKNIIRYFGKEVTPDYVLIAIELCTTNLSEFVTKLRSSYEEVNVMELLIQTTEGVAYLHENGIMHRDLKPENILLLVLTQSYFQVKVSDFGIAKEMLQGSSYIVACTSNHGTQAWSAPELLKFVNDGAVGELKMTCEMDIFSLGCIFFFVLSGGNHPFGKQWLRILVNIESGNPVELNIENVTEIVQNVATFIQVIHTMIALEMCERPSAKQVLKTVTEEAVETKQPRRYTHNTNFNIQTIRPISKKTPVAASHTTNSPLSETSLEHLQISELLSNNVLESAITTLNMSQSVPSITSLVAQTSSPKPALLSLEQYNINPDNSYTQLSPSDKKKVKNYLRTTYPNVDMSLILVNLEWTFIQDVINDKIPSLFKSTLPFPPPYYVERKFMKYNISFGFEGKSLSENDIIDQISGNWTIILFDKNISGNKSLLSDIGRKLSTLWPENIIIYAEFIHFIKDIDSIKSDLPMPEKISNILQKYVCKNKVDNFIFTTKLTNSKGQIIDLFLNGFHHNKGFRQKCVGDVLEIFSSNILPIRLWITTESTCVKYLVKALKARSFYIEPLDEESGIELITSYWNGMSVNSKQTKIKTVCK